MEILSMASGHFHPGITAVLTGLACGIVACADVPSADAVATVKDVMQGMTKHASDYIWRADDPGDDDAGWENIRLQAIMLAESGNLLQLGGRTHTGETWPREAAAMTNAAVEAGRAAGSKDFDRLFEAGGLIYESCAACHEEYLPK